MERVKKGEKYWHLYIGSRKITTIEKIDYYNSTDDDYFKSGDYFTTQEEAESMAAKLRAVLEGADVIEMPSEEEIEAKSNELRIDEMNFLTKTFGTERMSVLNTAGAWKESMENLVKWFQSKIVK